MRFQDIATAAAPIRSITISTSLPASVVQGEIVNLTKVWKVPLVARLEEEQFRMWPRISYQSGVPIVFGHIRADAFGGSELRATCFMGEAMPGYGSILLVLIGGWKQVTFLLLLPWFALGLALSYIAFRRNAEIVFDVLRKAAKAAEGPEGLA